MNFAEDDFLAISALQHFVYCRRQAALIHVERIWVENRETTEGKHLHRTVDEEGRRRELRGGRLTIRGLRLHSRKLGLAGRADVVEFSHEASKSTVTTQLSERSGYWCPRPVEYKRGRPKKHRADEVQLCAQALCLEEMLGASIPEGDLYYGKTRRRVTVEFDVELRDLVHSIVDGLRVVVNTTHLPPAEPGAKCRRCSLREACMPEQANPRSSAARYLSQTIDQILEDE